MQKEDEAPPMPSICLPPVPSICFLVKTSGDMVTFDFKKIITKMDCFACVSVEKERERVSVPN